MISKWVKVNFLCLSLNYLTDPQTTEANTLQKPFWEYQNLWVKFRNLYYDQFQNEIRLERNPIPRVILF